MSCANYPFLTRRNDLACSFSESKVYWVLDEENFKPEKRLKTYTMDFIAQNPRLVSKTNEPWKNMMDGSFR